MRKASERFAKKMTLSTIAAVFAGALAFATASRADDESGLTSSSSSDFAEFGRTDERSEDVTSCSAEPEADAAYGWFRDLQVTIEQNTGIAPKPEEKPPVVPVVREEPSPTPPVGVAPPVEEPEETTDIDDALAGFGKTDENEDVAEPDEDPVRVYDMKQPMLDRLRKEARAEAAECRTRWIKTRKGARAVRKCGISRSKFLCYQAVKQTLLDLKLTKRYLPHVPAKWAHQKGALKAEGFVNLLETERGRYNATNAPLGAVLVYDGGEKKCGGISCGHIEIKLNAAEYCSDYCKSIPIDKYLNRKLIGVYVKK